MKERGILFSAPMVRALLAGTKTQTRRAIKRQPLEWTNPEGLKVYGWASDPYLPTMEEFIKRCPYGQPGDRLYAKENAKLRAMGGDKADGTWTWFDLAYQANGAVIEYQHEAVKGLKNPYHTPDKTVPSIHMPRWASRITLELTDIRVQRLQDISEEDAMAEGVETFMGDCLVRDQRLFKAQLQFAALWDTINLKRGHGWDTNPWCWALTFRRGE